MARLGLAIPVAAACITAITLCFSACGLGSDMDVGDDREGQDSGGGSQGSGGSTVTGGTTATGGSATTGGTTAAGGVAAAGGDSGGGRATGGAWITSTDAGVTGGATSAGGAGTGGLRGIPCGPTICTLDLLCCNASCGLCRPPGVACTQEACEDPPSGVPCGNTVCGPGQECCNASCGTCVEKGGGCTQEICGPTTACTGAADCRLEADYCTGCNCRALSPGEKLPVCTGPGVRCLIDPCDGKAPTCKGGKCTVQ
jgi:hypothetical protein